jgi:sensor histidine kinase YesM
MNKVVRKHLYRDDIRKMLIMYSISFILISIILIYAFIGIYSKSTVRNYNHNSNNITKELINNEIQSYINAIYDLENEPIVQLFLETGEQQSAVYELLYDYINNRQVKSIFYIVDENGETILTNNYIKSPYNNYGIFLSGLFKQLKSNPDDIIFLSNKIQIDATKRTVYSIGKCYKINNKIKGYIVFDILESDLNKIVHKTNVDILVITDQYNNVIISTNSLVLNEIGKFKLIKNVKDTIKFNNKEYYYHKSELLDKQMYIYTLSELELISQLMTMSIVYSIILIIVLTIIIIVVAGYISKKKTESIEILIKSINKVQKGDFNALVNIKSNDEFEVIGNSFNDMIIELDKLIKNNSELIDRNRISEIKQLEAQFNPHFIFNTLETLKYMIYVNIQKATDIIVNFAKILRYSIDYNTKNIVLDEDLSYLKSYLLIQKYRFNNRLTYNISMDESAKDSIVPKLIMQPIIENCINHGYKSKDTLHIDLEIRVIDNDLVMKVVDNGDGIQDSRLEEIRKQLENENIVSNSIGLNNVHRRLKLLYGKQYGIKISSKIGEDTTVIIRIPNNKECIHV